MGLRKVRLVHHMSMHGMDSKTHRQLVIQTSVLDVGAAQLISLFADCSGVQHAISYYVLAEFTTASKICGRTNRLQEFEVLPQESGSDLGLKMLSALSEALQSGATKVSKHTLIVLLQGMDEPGLRRTFSDETFTCALMSTSGRMLQECAWLVCFFP